jgi:hypothetical protein
MLVHLCLFVHADALASALVCQHVVKHSDPIFAPPPSLAELTPGTAVFLYSTSHAERFARGLVEDYTASSWGRLSLRTARLTRVVVRVTQVERALALTQHPQLYSDKRVTFAEVMQSAAPLVLWDASHVRVIPLGYTGCLAVPSSDPLPVAQQTDVSTTAPAAAAMDVESQVPASDYHSSQFAQTFFAARSTITIPQVMQCSGVASGSAAAAAASGDGTHTAESYGDAVTSAASPTDSTGDNDSWWSDSDDDQGTQPVGSSSVLGCSIGGISERGDSETSGGVEHGRAGGTSVAVSGAGSSSDVIAGSRGSGVSLPPFYVPQVRLDAIHGMKRVTDACSKSHAAFRFLAAMTRDCFFIVSKEDVELVDAYLAASGMSANDIEDCKRHHWHFYIQHCRRLIPPSTELLRRFRRVCTSFGNIIDVTTREPLFNAAIRGKVSAWQCQHCVPLCTVCYSGRRVQLVNQTFEI